ncbi:MAG: hypothetical protein B6244_03745 [Candidatus Cloacimonetes bacterium 4572_55]|nr:MAG: hypothetical protein B6244_03745 [Candidatus Cloacimonetes bacterium 4572_55]
MRKYILILFILLLAMPSLGTAQNKVATTAAQFLKIGVGARAIGMGEAFTAVANDVSAIYYNPGGLSYVGGRTLYGTHIEWPADINYDFVAYSQPLDAVGGVVAVSFGAVTMDDMKRTDVHLSGEDGTTFGASCYLMAATYSRLLTDRFAIGGSFKWVQEYYDDESSAEPAFDIGAQYKTGFKSLRMGFAITNFGPDAKFIQESTPLPINFHFGVAYNVLETYSHFLVVAFDGAHPNDNAECYDLGLEYGFNEMFFLRGGYQLEYDAQSFALGGGVKAPIGSFNLGLDYAYQDLDWLDQSHRLSLSLQF